MPGFAFSEQCVPKRGLDAVCVKVLVGFAVRADDSAESPAQQPALSLHKIVSVLSVRTSRGCVLTSFFYFDCER